MSTDEILDQKTEKKEQKPKKKPAPKTEKKPETKKNDKPKTQVGLVANCNRLNVRSLGTMTSGVVAILTRGDSVLIDPEKSTHNWYSVKTKNGKNGYCLKQYIKIHKENSK